MACQFREKSSRLKVLCVSTVIGTIGITPQIKPVRYDSIPARYIDAAMLLMPHTSISLTAEWYVIVILFETKPSNAQCS